MPSALDIITAPARVMAAQSASAPKELGFLGRLHDAIDPVKAFGGYGALGAMALPMGRAVALPRPVIKRAPGGAVIEQKTPSGANVTFDLYRSHGDGVSVNLSFDALGSGTKKLPHGSPAPSMKEGLARLGEVFSSAESLVTKVRPQKLTFQAGSPALQRLYDRVAPKLAERLGGKLFSKDGNYTVTLPGARKFTKK